MGKKLKTKIIALFLAAFLTIPMLSGCEKNGDNLPSGGNNSEITDGENGNQGNGNQDNQGGNTDPGEEAQTFTVTFVSNGGTEIAPQQIKQGEKALVITFEQKSDGITTKLTTVNAEMLLVTKYIETLSDLQSLQTYAVATASSDTLGGYFVQMADISADGAKIQFGVINTTTWKVENRFGGVYDGRNHRIDSAYAELYGGIFTGISETGVVKNIVFTNAQLGNASSGAGGNGGFISTHCYGTIENVVVHGAATYSTDKNLPTSMIASNAYAGSKITNCLVILTGHWGWNTGCYGGMIVGNKKDGATITNCLGINLKETDNESYAIPAIGAGSPLLNTSNDTDTVHTIHGWTGHNDTTENAVDVSYDNWVAACADTAIYNNGTWYIDTTTKKLVVNNTAANEIISGLQG